MTTGGRGRSRARSTDVTTIAWAPSVSWQQSSNRNGSTIHREAACSASVIGLPWKYAAGFVAAYFRSTTATRPNASGVSPYLCRYRCAAIATHDAGVSSPNGSDHPSAAPSADGSRCVTLNRISVPTAH